MSVDKQRFEAAQMIFLCGLRGITLRERQRREDINISRLTKWRNIRNTKRVEEVLCTGCRTVDWQEEPRHRGLEESGI
jgi:hypothetical protein